MLCDSDNYNFLKITLWDRLKTFFVKDEYFPVPLCIVNGYNVTKTLL